MSEEKQIELMPCPFCGSADLVFAEVFQLENWTEIQCKNCGISMTDDNDENPVEAWNTRAENPRIANLDRENFEQSDFVSTLQMLCRATDYLLHGKDYDGGDYEEMERALKAASAYLAAIGKPFEKRDIYLYSEKLKNDCEIEKLRAENEKLRSAVVGNGLFEVKK